MFVVCIKIYELYYYEKKPGAKKGEDLKRGRRKLVEWGGVKSKKDKEDHDSDFS